MNDKSRQNGRWTPEEEFSEFGEVHTELFKQFSDNDSFRRWLSEMVFAATYFNAYDIR